MFLNSLCINIFANDSIHSVHYNLPINHDRMYSKASIRTLDNQQSDIINVDLVMTGAHCWIIADRKKNIHWSTNTFTILYCEKKVHLLINSTGNIIQSLMNINNGPSTICWISFKPKIVLNFDEKLTQAIILVFKFHFNEWRFHLGRIWTLQNSSFQCMNTDTAMVEQEKKQQYYHNYMLS